jgi:hypothetical protein
VDAFEVPDRPVYLVLSRRRRRGVRSAADQWFVEGVFLTAAEADAHGRANERFYFHGWRVLGAAAGGRLAALLPADDGRG